MPTQYFNYKISNESGRKEKGKESRRVTFHWQSGAWIGSKVVMTFAAPLCPRAILTIAWSLCLQHFPIARYFIHAVSNVPLLCTRIFTSVNTLGNTLCDVTKSWLTIRSVIARCLYRCLGLRREQLLTRDKRPIRRWYTNDKERKKGDRRLRLHWTALDFSSFTLYLSIH